MAYTKTKNDLIASIAEKHGPPKKAAGEAVERVLGAIRDELKAGNAVQLHGFGAFSVEHKPERQGRNPQTGAPVTIAAKDVAKFKPAKALLEG